MGDISRSLFQGMVYSEEWQQALVGFERLAVPGSETEKTDHNADPLGQSS
jgi:hypothetical protein